MANQLNDLANQYRSSRSSTQPIKETLGDLYNRFIREGEQSLMDATAAAVAVNALFLSDHIDMSQVTPQMEEAFNLAFPNHDLASLAARAPDEVEGFLAPWKGKYFEVLVRDDLNAGNLVGDIQLGPGQTVELAESVTQSGWDLKILESDGSIAQELQLKATESLSYVKQALERYPDIEVLTTNEVLAAGGDSIPGILGSGLSDSDLEYSVQAPMEALLDSPFEELLETVLPGLPFVLIMSTEGHRVLMGRKTFQLAMQDSLSRGIKTGAVMGVGGLVVLLDGGLLSIPASFLTRIGFDRYSAYERSEANLKKRITALNEFKAKSLMVGSGK